MTPAVKSPQKKNDALNDDEDDSKRSLTIFLIDLKHQKKTSTQIDSQTDSLSFLFLSVCFTYFVPTVILFFFKFRISDLQTDGKKSLTADTTNSREGKSTFIIIIIIIMRA